MRVKTDSAGVITAAGDALTAPYISFPVYLTVMEMMSLTVVTGMSGVKLLVQAGQVIAREDSPPPSQVTVTDIVTGATAVYQSDAINAARKTWTDVALTNSSGAVTFTLPSAYLFTITYAGASVVRDSAAPASATFAMVRSVSATSVIVQVFESKTTGILVGGTVEGLEPAGAGVQVLLHVTGL